MHKPQTGLDNRKIKILWRFLIQTHHQIQSTRKKIIFVNKQISKIVNIAVLTDDSLIKTSK